MTTYSSPYDWWLVVVLLLGPLGAIGGLVASSLAPSTVAIVVTCVTLFIVLLLYYLVLPRGVELTKYYITIKLPIDFRIPLQTIERVEIDPFGCASPYAMEPKWKFATSLKQKVVIVRYNAMPVTVSVNNPVQFVKEFYEVRPSLF
eukprot:m.72033 g.72033  ORF g.72033 m.72033 type:complete len:146 (+) comp8366_c0_seq3:38-475(+)